MRSVKDLVDAQLAGRTRTYSFTKTPTQATTAGLWFDLSMSPGNPPGKYWFDATPLTAKQVSQTTDGGIYHGPSVLPRRKYLRKLTVQVSAATPLPMSMLLCDYLLYYPTLDDGTTDLQVLDNGSGLSRYTDAVGVMPVAVTTAAHSTSPAIVCDYEAAGGSSGKQTNQGKFNSAGAIGTVATAGTISEGGADPFLSLQSGDTGVKLLNNAQLSKGDVGLFSLLLVKPLAHIMIKEATTVYEKDFFLANVDIPEIQDDAFLNFFVLPNGSLSSVQIRGDLQIVWD